MPSTTELLRDACSRCDQLNDPLVVADARPPHDSVVGCYKCRGCGYSWWTSYSPELLE